MSDHLPQKARELMEKLKASSTEKQRRLLNDLDIQLGGMVPAEGGGMMRVESLVASKTKNPMVHFIWGNNKGELTPIEARQYALQILESCEAAVQDAALYKAITDNGQDDQMAFGMINLVRDYRRKFEA